MNIALFNTTRAAVPFPVGWEKARARTCFAFVLATLLGLPFFISPLPAQTNAPPASGGRYLFIVDTSLAMRRRAENVQKAVEDLLLSGMNRQVRPGDTIGLWTFNEELHAGEFPLQRWTPQTRQAIASLTTKFLQGQRYEKRSRLDLALAEMVRVVNKSDKITVLIIFDGDNRVVGTPFDQEINTAVKTDLEEQRRLQMPFIAVLRARRGEFSGYKVNLAPWPVEFPQFPDEPQVAESPASKEKPGTKPQSNSAPAVVVSTNREPATDAVPAEPSPPPVESVASSATNQVPTSVAQTTSPLSQTTEVATASSPEAAPVAVKPADSKPAVPAPEASSPPPVQTATAVPSYAMSRRNLVLIGGAILLVVVLGLVFMLTRRSRPPQKISLITRSMDHDQK